jgi:NAD(P)-dependent dehydrogenase (short-subunit alcohol dehydrogenase family)
MTKGRCVAVVAGANVGFGSALAELLLSRGFRVGALGRETAARAVAAEVPGVLAVGCDLTDATEVDRAFAEVEQALGPVNVAVYNAHRIHLVPSPETTLEMFTESWRVNCLGAFVVAQRALPQMRALQAGTLIFSGATGSVRGGQRAAAFASSKFALRGMAQSLARELSPAGIHVAHVVLDGSIWSARTRARFPAAQESAAMSPHALAASYLSLIEQDRSAWTHELDLRPWTERF